MPHGYAHTMLENESFEPSIPDSPKRVRRVRTLEQQKRDADTYFMESKKIAEACLANGLSVEDTMRALDGDFVPRSRLEPTSGPCRKSKMPIPRRTVHLGN